MPLIAALHDAAVTCLLRVAEIRRNGAQEHMNTDTLITGGIQWAVRALRAGA